MKVFWREQPLSQAEYELFTAVLGAHAASTQRDNISTGVVRAAATGSGSYRQAIAAGLLTIGGVHAPLRETIELLNEPDAAQAARAMAGNGHRVPGWGSSFVKGAPDPIWDVIEVYLRACEPALLARIHCVTAVLHNAGKMIYPNASAYTAAAAIALQLPAPIADYLFVAGRLEAWTDLINQQLAH